MISMRIFTADGEKKFPNAVLIGQALHHSLATLMGIPTIMSYRNNKLLHWTCFDLQGAGALVFVFEYTRHLDVTKKSDMLQFLGCIFFVLLVFLWTRTFHWLYISSMFIHTWYQDEAWGFLVLGSIVLFFFSYLNIFVFTLYTFKRFMKFWKQYKEHNALPVDASPEEKRSSAIQLNIVASQVLSHHHLFYVPAYSEGKPTRTQSMPPLYSSFMGRTSMFVDLDKRMTYTFGDLSEQYGQTEKFNKDD